MKHIKEFLNGKVVYDKCSNMFFVNGKDGQQTVLDMRGWGHIQNMFKEGQKYDLDAAAEYQDRIGEFIAEAINEKMEREFTEVAPMQTTLTQATSWHTPEFQWWLRLKTKGQSDMVNKYKVDVPTSLIGIPFHHIQRMYQSEIISHIVTPKS